MQAYATKNDVREIVNKAVDDLTELITSFMQHADNRFNSVDNRFDRVENRLDGVEDRLDRVENRLDGVEMGLTKIEVKVDTINSGYNKRVSRIENWADKVSTKTKIQLSN